MTSAELTAWRAAVRPGDIVWTKTVTNGVVQHTLLADADGWFVDERWKYDVEPEDLFPTDEDATR